MHISEPYKLIILFSVLILSCFSSELLSMNKKSGGTSRKFIWKIAWSTRPVKSKDEIKQRISQAKAIGFNAIALPGIQKRWSDEIVSVGKEKHIEVYYVIFPHSGVSQKYEPHEYNLLPNSQHGGEPLPEDIGKVIDKKPKPFPCFIREEAVLSAQKDVDFAIKKGYTGIAFDLFGYDNFHGCYCASCNKARKKYLQEHPGMDKKEADHRFSEECIIKFYTKVISYAKSINPEIKTTCHIYPAFLPNILYGNHLPVDYCGQTAAWFFKPYWDLNKIKKYSEIIVKNEAAYHSNSIGVAMVGFYKNVWGETGKSPQRLKNEVETIKKAGVKGIMISELSSILSCPEIIQVLKNELK